VTQRRRPRLTSAEIVHDMAQTRARMARTLGVLDREYALRHLFVRATRFARHPEGGAHVIQDALRHDALPVAAIALGLGWLSFSRRPAGKELLTRLAGALATLQRIATDLGLLPPPSSSSASSPPSEAPATGEETGL
jgi:hypothetical protein